MKRPAVSAAGILCILVLAAGLASCATKLPPVADEASSAEIIQLAQDRSDIYDWKGAQYYYKLLLERFPSDRAIELTARYELAFIDYKQGRYEQARAGFQTVLDIYAEPGNENLPATWKILSQKVMEKLPPVK